MSSAIREDRWSVTEDEVIKQAVKKYGSNQWNRVASLLSRKSAAQCRARWFEVLKPEISHAEWTATEDSLLLELARRMPNMWRSISATLGGRSANQCHERYTRLVSDKELDIDNKPGGSSAEMGEEAKNELKAEASARLANSLGRKAKRKQRERAEDEIKFEELVKQNKEQKRSPYLNSPQVDPGSEEIRETTTGRTRAPPSRKGNHPRHTRPELELPDPIYATHDSRSKYHHLQHITLSSDTAKKLADALDAMPPPRNGTLKN